jgi:hypothetical protein
VEQDPEHGGANGQEQCAGTNEAESTGTHQPSWFPMEMAVTGLPHADQPHHAAKTDEHQGRHSEGPAYRPSPTCQDGGCHRHGQSGSTPCQLGPLRGQSLVPLLSHDDRVYPFARYVVCVPFAEIGARHSDDYRGPRKTSTIAMSEVTPMPMESTRAMGEFGRG